MSCRLDVRYFLVIDSVKFLSKSRKIGLSMILRIKRIFHTTTTINCSSFRNVEHSLLYFIVSKNTVFTIDCNFIKVGSYI